MDWRTVDELAPYTRNARTHTKKQIHQIAASIKEFGFTNPVLIDASGGIIAGHGRLEAAKLLGLHKVPTIRLDHLTDAQKRAYVIADNRLAELAGWDDELLAVELQYLSEIELDFDVEITGFETAEIDLLIESLDASGEESDPADEVPEIDEHVPAVTQPGDLWVLGAHRLLCADALKPESHERLMDGAKATMVFTDPPYNVPIDGHVCGLGKVKHREFAMASGEMGEAEFAGFLETVLANLARSCVDGAILDVCMDWRHLYELLTASRNAGLPLLNLCVWNKTNGGMGSFYRSKHELICVFKSGNGPHINNVELGRFGRYRTNVWDYAGVNTLRKGRLEELSMHPTVKPVALVADAIKDCTRRRDIVLDPFTGSGTTLIAAERTGRAGYGLELDPLYVDTAVRRWERFTDEKAVHAETGLPFDELADARGVSAAAQAGARADAAVTAGREVSHGN
ncbi:MAG: site-specific DNA-methyltransferase [Planctomycetota bacterium]